MYSRIETNCDVHDQNYNKLTFKFGFKCQYVRELTDNSHIMEVFVPIIMKKGLAKIAAREKQHR